MSVDLISVFLYDTYSITETKKNELEAATVIVDEKDKKALGIGLSNINKISLVNVIEADDE